MTPQMYATGPGWIDYDPAADTTVPAGQDAPAPQVEPAGYPCLCGCRKPARMGRKYRPGHDNSHVWKLVWEAQEAGSFIEETDQKAARVLSGPLYEIYRRRTEYLR